MAKYKAVLEVHFEANDSSAADQMSSEILRLWNEEVLPDTPSTLSLVELEE